MSKGSCRDQDAATIFERCPDHSARWIRLALKLERSNGIGKPIEMRSSAFGGSALLQSGGRVPAIAGGSEKAEAPKGKFAIRAVTDARSS